MNEKLMNVTVYDNGACFMVQVNGLIVKSCNSLGNVWRHIQWMHKIASQNFTVGKKEVPVAEWIEHMTAAGYLD